MIAAMIDANHISERLASLKLEMSDLRVANARYWSRKEHTALDKSASALRQQRLIQIKLELADMRKRCNLWPSSPPSFSAPLRLRQSRRASTYLQGNSRVDERSIGHFNGPIPLTKVSSCRRILTAWDGSWFCGRDTSDWRFQPRLFSSLRPRFEISNTRTSFSVRVAISQ